MRRPTLSGSTPTAPNEEVTDRYGIAIFWSDEDGQWISIIPDLRGCSASGDTPEEALQEIQIAKDLWLESSRDHDWGLPEPKWRPKEAVQAN